jgi:hypothetical protein
MIHSLFQRGSKSSWSMPYLTQLCKSFKLYKRLRLRIETWMRDQLVRKPNQ